MESLLFDSEVNHELLLRRIRYFRFRISSFHHFIHSITRSLNLSISSLFSRRLDGLRDRVDDPAELGDLDLKLLSAQRRQPVIARPAIPRRHAPLRFHPAFDQHALQGGV